MINTQVYIVCIVYVCLEANSVGSIIGFVQLGDINSHFAALENQLDNDQLEPLANSMLAIFVRGLFSNLNFAYSQFPCTSLSGDKLYDPFWEAVDRLELCGFKVMGLTCDGLSVNRRLFSLHDPSAELLHKVPNPYADDGRDLFFFADPPHLMKTTRNAWASKTRHLWVWPVNKNFICYVLLYLVQWKGYIVGPSNQTL